MSGSHDPGEIPLSRLIQDLEDGDITQDDRSDLMERLRHSESARETYLDHITLAALLRQTAETRGELGTIPVSREMLRRATRKSALAAVSWGIAAVLVCAIGLMLFKVRLDFGATREIIAMDQSQDATFHIERGTRSSGREGSLHPGDRISLERGLLQLGFPKGVEAIVEGPCELEVTSSDEIRLDGGMSWFRVPKAGRGFTVRTDRAKVIDLGTEFGIRFDGGDDVQVHVVKGRVRVEPRKPGKPSFEVTQGEAVGVGEDGASRDVDLRATLFRRKFSKSVPYVHWSFDWLVDGGFPATGTMPDAPTFRAELRHRDGSPGDADKSRCQTEGIRGKAFAMTGDGLFAESAFPGIGGTAPRTVAAWIRHRGSEKRFGDATNPLDDPYSGFGATTPFGEQAFLLNYASTGLTTAPGAITETLAPGIPYTLSFHVAARPGVPNARYRVELVAFDAEHDENARRNHGSDRTGQILAFAEGEAFAHDLSERDEVTFTAAADDPNLGKEIGIRLVHVVKLVMVDGRRRHSGRVLYDHISLTARNGVSESREIFSEEFEEPRVVGFANGVIPTENWIAAGSSSCGLFNHRPPDSTPYFAWGKHEPDRMWAGFVHEGRTLSWTTGTGKSWVGVTDSAKIEDKHWTHVASVFTGGFSENGEPEIIQYVNGQRTESRLTSGRSTNTGFSFDSYQASTLLFGALPGSGSNDPTLDGDIDEVFIFRGALEGGEVRKLMETNIPVFPKE